jgi:hypothetical protein
MSQTLSRCSTRSTVMSMSKSTLTVPFTSIMYSVSCPLTTQSGDDELPHDTPMSVARRTGTTTRTASTECGTTLVPAGEVAGCRLAG